jgi:hypothetical protein
MAGFYIAYSEGDYGPLSSSTIGFAASGIASFGVKAFGGSITQPVIGVMVTKQASPTSIAAAGYAAGQAGSNATSQACN